MSFVIALLSVDCVFAGADLTVRSNGRAAGSALHETLTADEKSVVKGFFSDAERNADTAAGDVSAKEDNVFESSKEEDSDNREKIRGESIGADDTETGSDEQLPRVIEERSEAYDSAAVKEVTEENDGPDADAYEKISGLSIAANTANSAAMRKKISAKTAPKKKKLNVNLKKLLGETRTGYSVPQGACTDGKYVYYLMVSTYTQKGRVLKLRKKDNAVMAKSGIININHGNGMALDTKRHRLVVVGKGARRNQLTIINVGTGKKSVPVFEKYANINYRYSAKWATSKKRFDSLGLSAISYIARYDCFIALQRASHDLLVMDPDFRVIGLVRTKISAKYPGTYQAMDSDERYVYLMLSPYNNKQPYNRILALDWNSEILKTYVKDQKKYIKKAWACNDSGDGTPDADIRVKAKYEAENLYHVDNGNGKARFYVTEYFSNPKYHWVTKTEAYKKNNKTMTREVRVYEINYYNRDSYVYDIGVF